MAAPSPANRLLPGLANSLDSSSCRSLRRFTTNALRRVITSVVCAPRARQTSSRGGLSETDVSEFTVMPRGSPSHAVVTTATPVAKPPIMRRIAVGST